MVYRRRSRTVRKRPMSFKKKRVFKRKMKLKRQYKRNIWAGRMSLKIEIRNDVTTTNFGVGSVGYRSQISWGKRELAGATNWSAGNNDLFALDKSYEWSEWKGKFEEYRIIGVKVKV